MGDETVKWYMVSFKNWYSQYSFTEKKDVYKAENPKEAIKKAEKECQYRFELINIKLIESE